MEHLDTFHMYWLKPDNRDISHILPGATFIDLEQVDVRKVYTICDIVARENFAKCTCKSFTYFSFINIEKLAKLT